MTGRLRGEAARRRKRRHHRGGCAALALGVVTVSAACGSSAAGRAVSAHQPAPTTTTSTTTTQPPTPADPSAAYAPPPTTSPQTPGLAVPSGQAQSDPVLYAFGSRYFLYTSDEPGPPVVNVPVSSSTDFANWSPVTDALPALPPWAVPGFTWAPDVHRFGSRYVLYFTALLQGSSPSMECVGDATGATPTGPFTAEPDPFICQRELGGTIDPRVFTDSDGTPWMLFKSEQNIGGADTPTKMWSQRLAPGGLALVGQPTELMGPDEPWQGTIVEAPDMVLVGGTYWLFYSGNWFNQPAYAIGAARCSGAAGPCADVSSAPVLASNSQGQGPGEASVFEDASGVWLLYSPWRSLAPRPDIPPRPVYITRLGFAASGPYLAAGGPPPDLPAPAPHSSSTR